MAGERAIQRLADLCSLINRGVAPCYTEAAGLLVLNQRCIRNQTINITPARRTDKARKPISPTRLLQPNDILVNSTGVGTLGRIAQVVRLPEPATVDSHITIVRPNPSQVDPRYLGFDLRLREAEIESLATGSTGQTELSRSDLGDLSVELPPLHQQRAIADLLSALDYKIDVNRRMAETLEAVARALFKSWFVEFDPVRAKAEGRPTRLPKSIDEAFPQSLSQGFPSGWTMRPLRELFRVLSGGTPSKNEKAYWAGDIPWVTPRAMTCSHVSEAPDSVTLAAIGNGTRLAPAGSIFVMVRGMGLHQGVRVSQARCEVTFNQDVKALVPERLDSSFLLYALLEHAHALRDKVRAAGHGTGVLPTDALDAIRVFVPPPNARELLFSPFAVVNERVALARSQAKTLASLRDAMLPKLISGELHITGAAELVKVVA